MPVNPEGKFKPLFRLDFGTMLGSSGGVEIRPNSLDLASCPTLGDVPQVVDVLKELIGEIEEGRAEARREMTGN